MKMNKKLERLRDKEAVEKIGKSCGDDIVLHMTSKVTQPQKEIKVYSREVCSIFYVRDIINEFQKRSSNRKANDPTLPNTEKPEIKPETTNIEFETVVRGKKQKIDSDFLNKFGIKID